MLELLAGVVVAVAALAAVLEPLVSGPRRVAASADEPDLVDLEESDSPKIRALLALKEIEFDRATGKLSDEDYETLKSQYARAAVEALKEEEGAEAAVAGAAGALDAAEAAVSRVKGGAVVCPACGPRPEPAARFCSSCGRSLTRSGARPRCGTCGTDLPDGAKYCAGCGGQIAA